MNHVSRHLLAGLIVLARILTRSATNWEIESVEVSCGAGRHDRGRCCTDRKTFRRQSVLLTEHPPTTLIRATWSKGKTSRTDRENATAATTRTWEHHLCV